MLRDPTPGPCTLAAWSSSDLFPLFTYAMATARSPFRIDYFHSLGCGKGKNREPSFTRARPEPFGANPLRSALAWHGCVPAFGSTRVFSHIAARQPSERVQTSPQSRSRDLNGCPKQLTIWSTGPSAIVEAPRGPGHGHGSFGSPYRGCLKCLKNWMIMSRT